MKTYTLATEINDIVTWLNLPLFTLQAAENHAKTLRELSPSSKVFVLNTTAE